MIEPLPVTEVSYDKAWEQLGGKASLESLRPLSIKIGEKVRLENRANKSLKQSSEMQSLDLDSLFAWAAAVKPAYDALLEHLVQLMRGKGIQATYQAVGLKRKQRAQAKATIKYGGDVSFLVDIVRGSLIFSKLEDMYAGMLVLLESADLHGDGFWVAEFGDRYQKPLSGGYADCQMVLGVEGMLCELQINTEAMSEAKHRGGHKAYGQTRFVHEYLLYSAIHNDIVGANKLLQCGKVTNCDMVRDRNGFSALGFACVHRNAELSASLLNAGASPFHVSNSGQLPLHLAITRRDYRIATLLVERMSQSAAEVVGDTTRLQSFHLCLAAALHTFLPFTSEDERQQVQRLLQALYQLTAQVEELAPESFWHRWAWYGLTAPAEALLKAAKAASHDDANLVKLAQRVSQRDASGRTPLDIAASQEVDAEEFVRLLVNERVPFAKLQYIHEVGQQAWATLRAMDKGDLLHVSPERIRTTFMTLQTIANRSTLALNYGCQDVSAVRREWPLKKTVPQQTTAVSDRMEYFDGVEDETLLSEVMAFLMGVRQRGPLAIVIDVVSPEAMLLTEILLPTLWKRLPPSECRLILLVPTQRTNRNDLAGSGSPWPYASIMCMGQLVGSSQRLEQPPASPSSSASASSSSDTEQVDKGEEEAYALSRPLWSKYHTSRVRIAAIAHELWYSSVGHQTTLETVVDELESNMHASLGCDSRDLDWQVERMFVYSHPTPPLCCILFFQNVCVLFSQ